MPTCSIIQCGARKSPNQPHLTMHSLYIVESSRVGYQNEELEEMVLKIKLTIEIKIAIALKHNNINSSCSSLKMKCCARSGLKSLGWKKSNLDLKYHVSVQYTLQNHAVPSIHLVRSKKPYGLVLREIKNVEEQAFSMMTQPPLPVKHLDQIYKGIEPESFFFYLKE